MLEALRKSLRRSYLFVIGVSFLIFTIGFYFMWEIILDEERNRLIYSNKIISNSMRSLLDKNEALFDITGNQLVEIGIFNNIPKSQTLINSILAKNTELAGIGIANPKGQLIITTANIDTNKLPQLLEKKETAESFKLALNSDTMVIGRTYFMEGLNEWLVPLRYRIINKQNQVVAVFTTGLKLDNEHNPWLTGNMKGELQLSIINSDFYFQYATPLKPNELNERYNQPISKDYIALFEKHLIDQTSFTLDNFLEGKKDIATLIYPKPNGENSLAAISFDSKYKLFTFTIQKVSNLYNKLITPMSWLFALLFTFNLILYFLFKYHSKLQRRAKNILEYQAQHDQLTGLPNIRYLVNNIDSWYKKLQGPFSYIFIDLDNFKNSNDIHGHTFGDKILCVVATRIKSFFTGCQCIRQGGDEFIILAPYAITNASENICHEFLIQLKQAIVIDDIEVSIHASIGISNSPNDGYGAETMLRKADIAMYEAKRHKTGVRIFSNELEIQSTRKAIVAKELNSAIEKNEMQLVYQPQFESVTNKIIGVEALIRWNNKHLGEVSPDEFIPIAESTGVIIEIGKFVLETALIEYYEICQRILNNKNEKEILRLSINVSIRQLSDVGFIDMLFSLVDKYDCKNTKLMLEITETLTIDKIDEIRLTLNQIQEAGIEISLDDFGTGFSSLTHLSKLPINELKIDKSFVRGIPNIKQDVVLVNTIINLGEGLNLKVMAEGVENIEQVEILTQFGCKYYQGYYFSKPLDKISLEKYLISSFNKTASSP